MTLALLCSGQGRQHADMFALTAGAAAAAPVFAAATRTLGGRHPLDLLVQGDEAIHANMTGQILCCTQALAAHAALREAIGPKVTLAGYSVGELAAWGCAGLLPADATLALAHRRAEIMDEVGGLGGGLVFVRGLRREKVDDLCARFDAAVAIVNPGNSYVIGGLGPSLAEFCQAATRAGASRAGLLAVHVASHTARLAPAVPVFRAALDGAGLRSLRPGIRLLSGIDGTHVSDIRNGADKLAEQIAQTVQWATCLETCAESGVTACLELGPGRALADMVVEAYPDIQARSIDEFRSLDGVRAWIKQAIGAS